MLQLMYLVLISSAIFVIQAILRWCFFATKIWPSIVFLYRARYALLIIGAPAILGLIAIWQRFILYTLLVLRDQACPANRELLLTCLGLAHNTYYLDLISITILSILTVCLGFAGLRLIELYGVARFGNAIDLLALNCPASISSHANTSTNNPPSTGWPWWKYVVLLLSGLSLPAFAIYASVHDQKIPAVPNSGLFGVWGSSILAVIYGMIVAAAVIKFLILVEIFLPGPETDPCGLLPLENLRFWPTVRKKPSPWLLQLAAWWFKGPGYTQPSGTSAFGVVFNPGHVQLVLMVTLSLIVYAKWTLLGYQDDTWENYRWPTLWYAEMLVFLIGMLLMGFAFWLDRAGVPPTVVIAAWVSLMYVIGGTDNFYQLNPKLTAADHTALTKRIATPEVQTTEHCFVKVVRERLKFENPKPEENQQAAKVPPIVHPPLWKTLTGPKWQNFPQGPDGKRTLVLVTAAGGGIQASAWTAKVLTGLDEQFEGFTQSVGLVSSVSGGSIGTMFYLGHRGPRSPKMKISMEISADGRAAINKSASESLLEPVGWGAAFPDLVRNVLPGLAPTYEDRGWALESACWNRMGPLPGDRPLMKDLRMGDLATAFQEGVMPAVVFNSTAVETGQRVMIASADMTPPEGETVTSLRNDKRVKRVDTPVDWFDFYHNDERSLHPESVNPRVSTAARLSASFSYAAPVARPNDEELCNGNEKPATRAPANQQDKTEAEVDSPDVHARQARIHLCDGGYASNSGLTTAINAVRDLMDQLSDPSLNEPGFDRILIVRIEPFPQSLAQYSKNSDGLVAQFAGPLAATANARISTQAERDEADARLISHAAQNILKRALERKIYLLEQAKTPNPKGLERLRSRLTRLNDNWMSVDWITMQFKLEQSKSDPPLSWKLIPTAARDIENSWNRIKKDFAQTKQNQPLATSEGRTRRSAELGAFFKHQPMKD